jgi:two-component system OmpR family response regulator
VATVLVVEDDAVLARTILQALEADGHVVHLATSGHQALGLAGLHAPRVVVLDLGLPDMPGLAVLEQLRAERHDASVMILTARDGVHERVKGLRAGADDYLGKPFALAELRARVAALSRRTYRRNLEQAAVGPLRLDPHSRRAWHGEVELALSPREFELLHAFMRRPGEVLDRAWLLREAWDPEMEDRSNVVSVYVAYLRAKIDEPFGTDLLQTARGHGYRLDAS